MKKISTIFFFLNILVVFSQNNLIQNYSFEQYDTCPNTYSQIYRAVPWFQPFLYTGFTTSDFFNVCANNNSPANVPNNWVGYQNPRTGNGYGGIVIFREIDWREYLEGLLTDTLQGGKKYCVEFYISLAEISNWTISNIGLFFSQDSVIDTVGYNLPYFPQIINPPMDFLIDTAIWMKISDVYTATGGEKFITIGNFMDNANTNAIFIGDSSTISDTMAYYYIDDVSVTLCTDSCQRPVAKFNYNANDLTASFYNLTSDVCSDCNWFWYFGDGNSDTSKNPVHIYDSAGIYTATFVACNQTGCCNELCCDTMVGQVSVSVGVDEFNNENYKLQVYPNPADEEVTITAKGGEEIIITDLTGRKIKEYKISLNQLKINTDEYDNGIYFLCLYSNGRIAATEKMVIVR